MPAEGRTSLADFARTDTRTKGCTCWMCSIPERAECETAVAAGVPRSVVRRWLRDECGYGDQATVNRVENHFREHVR